MIWTDIATWIGPTDNRTTGAMSTIVGVVLHVQQGTEAGTEAWQKNPASRVSSHFLAPKGGRGKQMVDTSDKAWCEVDGNAHWLSIECEGVSGQTLTPDQIEFCAQILALAYRYYNIPLAVTNNVNNPGLGHHSMGGVPWGNHPDCPGGPIIDQKPAIVVRAAQILGVAMTEQLTPTEQGEIYNSDAVLWAVMNMFPGVKIASGDNPTSLQTVTVPLVTFLQGLLAQSQSNGAGISDLRATVADLVKAVAALQASMAALSQPIIKWPSPPVTITWTAPSDTTNAAK